MNQQANDIETAEIAPTVSQSELIAALGVEAQFPPLSFGCNRPVTWQYQLDSIKGQNDVTNSVTIYSRVYLELDESGQNGLEKFATVTLTRAEIAEILRTLEEDITDMRTHCPDSNFV